MCDLLLYTCNFIWQMNSNQWFSIFWGSILQWRVSLLMPRESVGYWGSEVIKLELFLNRSTTTLCSKSSYRPDDIFWRFACYWTFTSSEYDCCELTVVMVGMHLPDSDGVTCILLLASIHLSTWISLYEMIPFDLLKAIKDKVTHFQRMNRRLVIGASKLLVITVSHLSPDHMEVESTLVSGRLKNCGFRWTPHR